MGKYKPETVIEKKNRLKSKAESKVAKKDAAPPKRPNKLRSGTNTVTKLVEQKKAQLVVIAHDVDPIEVCIKRKTVDFRFFCFLIVSTSLRFVNKKKFVFDFLFSYVVGTTAVVNKKKKTLEEITTLKLSLACTMMIQIIKKYLKFLVHAFLKRKIFRNLNKFFKIIFDKLYFF